MVLAVSVLLFDSSNFLCEGITMVHNVISVPTVDVLRVHPEKSVMAEG